MQAGRRWYVLGSSPPSLPPSLPQQLDPPLYAVFPDPGPSRQPVGKFRSISHVFNAERSEERARPTEPVRSACRLADRRDECNACVFATVRHLSNLRLIAA